MGVVYLGDRLKVHRSEREVERDREHQKLQRKIVSDRAHAIKQKAQKAKRYASWANSEAIKRFYTQAQKMTEETGIEHEVDHIIPLLGKNVSGLHVETNLQVIPKEDNRRKSNHYEM